MKPTKRISAPSNLLFFDTETRGEIVKESMKVVRHSLWFGIVNAFRYVDGQRTRQINQGFKTIADFWKIVQSRLDPSRPLWVFAHNLGFDLTIVDFWRESEARGWKSSYVVLEDPPTFIRMDIGKSAIYFVDTLNYWRTSLAELGKSLGVAKLPMPAVDSPFEEWKVYCNRDVEILAQSVTGLIDYLINNDLGTFALTAPSIAMSVYKHRFMDYMIFVHDNIHALDLERSSYYGGLVSCYFIGKVAKGEVFHLDVNSLYPSVMLNDYPTKLLRVDRHINTTKLLMTMQTKGAVAKVKIKSDTNTYPLRWQKKLLDVKGDFTTYLCGEELRFALEQDDIAEVEYAAVYDLDPIFTSFVNYFWNERLKYKKANDNVKQLFCKLMMNSLYGKFGQKAYEWLTLDIDTIKLIYERNNLPVPKAYLEDGFQPSIKWSQNKWLAIGLPEPLTVRATGGLIQVKVASGEHIASSPIIAAYVTSYARQKLRGLVSIAGQKQVYYCDTDSLFVSSLGYKRLTSAGCCHNSELGKLKLEGSSMSPKFYGPKDYQFGSKEVIKGIRDNAIEIGVGEYLQNQFEGLKSVLAREPDPYIEIRWMIKRNRRLFGKGLVDSVGWVAPFIAPHQLPDIDKLGDNLDW